MYQGNGSLRLAPRVVESPSGAAPEAAARLVLDRVRKALTAHVAGVRLDPARMLQVLSAAAAPVGREAERSLALGWLHWLDGNFAAAEPLLAEAIRLARRQEGAPLLAEAAYWHGRVRLQLGRPEALSEYEVLLRETRGAPQAVVVVGGPAVEGRPRRSGRPDVEVAARQQEGDSLRRGAAAGGAGAAASRRGGAGRAAAE